MALIGERKIAQEERILKCAEALFAIDRDKDPVLWQTKLTAMTGYIFQYYTEVYSLEVIQDFGVEIMDWVSGCVRSFDPGKGSFLCYLNRAVSLNMKHKMITRQIEESRGGGTVSEKKDRKTQAALHLAEDRDANIRDPVVQENISEIIGLSVEELRECIAISFRSRVRHEYARDPDGEEYSVFETVASPLESPEVSALACEGRKEELEELFASIDFVWSGKQDRVKRFLSRLVTRDLLSNLEPTPEITMLVTSWLKSAPPRFAFLDGDLANSFVTGRDLPSQKEIAVESGGGAKPESCEQRASRELKKLYEDVKKESS